MITIHYPIEFEETYPLERIGRKEDLLFFDIETTGFSGDTSNLYLIGCVFYRENTWQLVQWFADTAQSEVELLHEFFKLLNDFKLLVHFNGDGFDIPYLQKRCRHFQLDYSFDSVESFDIYKKIKPYRCLLGLDSMKQKALEHFLGIFRQDKYNGGQLIEVYHDYLRSHDKFLYDMLILHNEEDLKGMPCILPILNYSDFLEHDFFFHDIQYRTETDIFGCAETFAVLNWESPYEIPVPWTKENGLFTLHGEGNLLSAQALLFQGELRHYYPDYKDYYYLIYEDMAVHKSVGEYVEKDARKKATAKTCYTRHTGTFLPQSAPVFQPVMQKDYKDALTYTPWNEELFQDSGNADRYLRAVLEVMSKKGR